MDLFIIEFSIQTNGKRLGTIRDKVETWAQWLVERAELNEAAGITEADYPGKVVLWGGDELKELWTWLEMPMFEEWVDWAREEGWVQILRETLTEEAVAEWLQQNRNFNWNQTLYGIYDLYLHYYLNYKKDNTARKLYGGDMQYHEYYDYMIAKLPIDSWYFYSDYARDYYGLGDYYDYYDYYYSGGGSKEITDRINSEEEHEENHSLEGYDDDYFYYDDQWVNYNEAVAYMTRMLAAFKKIEESGEGNLVALKVARIALKLAQNLPIERALDLLSSMLKQMRVRLETGPDGRIDQSFEELAEIYWKMQVGGWNGMLQRLVGDSMWEQMDEAIHDAMTQLEGFLYQVAKTEGLLPEGCGDWEITPHPFGCTTSYVLWEMLFVLEDLALGQRRLGLQRARKMVNFLLPKLHKLEDWMGQGWGWMNSEQQAESVYCRLTSALLDLEIDLLIVGLGEEVTHSCGRQLLITNHHLGKSLLDTCPASDITLDTRGF